jgi:hypothetical protein
MYGLSEDLDLNFLSGRQVEQVAIGIYQIIANGAGEEPDSGECSSVAPGAVARDLKSRRAQEGSFSERCLLSPTSR